MSAESSGNPDSRLLPVHHAFVRNAHSHPFRFAIADVRRPRMNFATTLLTALFLAQRLKTVWTGQEMVGIMLPPSVPAALVNVAAMLCGKIPVNLNYSVSDEEVESCVRRCGLQTVIATKPLLDRLGIGIPAETVLLETIAARPKPSEKLRAMLLWFRSAQQIEKSLGVKRAGINDVATVAFSEDGTGSSQCIELRYSQIASQMKQISDRFALRSKDCVLGAVPFFEPFGFMMTLCLPAVLGIPAVYHPSPFDVAAVSELARDYSVSFLPTTPAFLKAYLQGVAQEDFAHLRHVLVGTEDLSADLSAEFQRKFGIPAVQQN